MSVRVEGTCGNTPDEEPRDGDLFCRDGAYYQLREVRGYWILLNLSGGYWSDSSTAIESAFGGGRRFFTKLQPGDFLKLVVE